MPSYETYLLEPLSVGMATEFPSLHIPGAFSPDMVNVRINQNSIMKRPGYLLYRSLGEKILNIARVEFSDGSKYTVVLTDANACKIETSGSNTFSYITETYTTGKVTSTGGTGVEGTDSPAWATGVAASDKFILDTDHQSAVEADTNWTNISSVTDNDTLVLSGNYTGTSGSWPSGVTYKIRKVYTTPTNERWSWTVVTDKFCFTNGDTNVQSWTGTGTATALNSTYATKARYCIGYAERLFIADCFSGGLRDPYLLKWSATPDADPAVGGITVWDPAVNSTAGSLALIDNAEYITGLGNVGGNLIVYKRESILVYARSGDATDPIYRTADRRGIGCIAPYSIVDILGSNAFLGNDDFYRMDGDMPTPISKNKLRFKFFDIVTPTERQNTWGGVDYDLCEAYWVANTTSGKYIFVWKYDDDHWYIYSMQNIGLSSFGKGVV